MKQSVRKALEENKGIYSVCSTNRYVLEASMRFAKKHGSSLLIEATSNQVNQFGGYTGMTPRDFVEEVCSIANKEGFPLEQLIIGGDHLGPHPWKEHDNEYAMKRAEELIKSYVEAGFTKIHIDTSMQLGNEDITGGLRVETVAQRCAQLAETVYATYDNVLSHRPDAVKPVLVVGSEVPLPGGSLDEGHVPTPTKAEDFVQQVMAFKNAFENRKLDFSDVIGFVVQPGVEFGDDSVYMYSRENARKLCQSLNKYEGLVFEGHSTDYQTAKCLKEMVEDGIKILKVGPELTFAFREAVMLMSYIEEIMLKQHTNLDQSRFAERLLKAMDENPGNWIKYYSGTDQEIEFKKIFSFCDRCRYYLNEKSVIDEINRLVNNLKGIKIPLSLISMFMPVQYKKIMSGELEENVVDIIYDRITCVLERYQYACA